MVRGIAFTTIYYVLSFVYVLLAIPTLAIPGRGATSFLIKSYTHAIRIALRFVAGIHLEIRGREHLPDGPFIVAAKHQSWGDGFMIYPEIDDLTFVTGDHLEKFPFVASILRKLGAIVIDTCGGGDRKAQSLTEGLARARKEGRRILIYPEGHLAPPKYHYRYKAGVWHMQKAMDVPVIPVATNLGCFWKQEELRKTPGTCILEFCPPIAPGKAKDVFMKQLTETVEMKSAHLLSEAWDENPAAAILLPDPAKNNGTAPSARAT